jgi:hypothetical protein
MSWLYRLWHWWLGPCGKDRATITLEIIGILLVAVYTYEAWKANRLTQQIITSSSRPIVALSSLNPEGCVCALLKNTGKDTAIAEQTRWRSGVNSNCRYRSITSCVWRVTDFRHKSAIRHTHVEGIRHAIDASCDVDLVAFPIEAQFMICAEIDNHPGIARSRRPRLSPHQ